MILRQIPLSSALLLVCLLLSWQVVFVLGSNCKTYAQRCLVVLGEALVNPLADTTTSNTQQDSNTIFYLETTIRDSIYAVLEHPGVGVSSLSISTSILYGTVDIYVNKNTEPSTTSSSHSSSDGYLLVDLSSFTQEDAINILVKSTTPSALKVVVSTSSVLVKLPLGFPLLAHTNSGQKFTYTNAPSNDHPFYITIMPLSLAVPMITATDSSSSANSFSTSGQGNVQLSIPSSGTYTMTVTSMDDVYDNNDGGDSNEPVGSGFPYVILISINDEVLSPPVHTHLLSALPLYHQVTPTSTDLSYQHFIYVTHYSPSNRHISLVLETLTGNADLLVNNAESGFPTSEELATWSSTSESFRDQVAVTSLPSIVPAPSSSKLFISIRCAGLCIYTLRAFEDLYLSALIEGSVISTDVLQGSYRYFYFKDSHQEQDLVISLTRISGDPDLYIGCAFDPTGDGDGSPSLNHNIASSNDYSTDILHIGAEDASKRCSSGDYYIAVKGFGWTSTSTRAAFSLSVKHRLGLTTLISGVPVQDTLDSEYSGRYQVHSGASGGQLIISVTLTYGDVDMYVKMNGQATEFDYDFQDSSSFWADVDDDWWTMDDDDNDGDDDGDYTLNAKRQRRLTHDNDDDDDDDDNEEGFGYADTRRIVISANEICDNCWINILLVPYEHTQLSIVAQLKDMPIQLQEGIPLRHVSSNTVQYFSFSPESFDEVASTVKIVVTNMNQAQLVLSATGGLADVNDQVSNTVTDASAGHVLEVMIRSSADLSISVGAGSNASYTIRASTLYADSPYIYTLLNGLVQGDEIAPYEASYGLQNTAWSYYQILLNPGHERLTVRLSSYQGTLDMYIRRCPSRSVYQCSTYYLPNTTSLLTNRRTGRSSIEIDRSDVDFGSYIVGVHSRVEGSSCKYTVSYALAHSALSLIADVPSLDYVVTGEIDFYSFYFHGDTRTAGVKFLLSSTLGFPDMYISTSEPRPSAEKHTWSSDLMSLAASSVVSISPDDENYCSDCTYYIAISASFVDASYSITASTHGNDDSSTVIIGGQPYTDTIHNAFTSHHYIYHVDTSVDGDLLLNVAPRSGMIDVYVTLDGQEPSFLHHDYHSLASLFSEDIRIKRADGPYTNNCLSDDAAECIVRIKIYAYLPSSTYTITITSSSAVRVLQVDVPTSTNAAVGEYRYFMVQLHTTNIDEYQVRFTTSMSVGRVMMYVSCTNESPNDGDGQHDFQLDTSLMQQLDVSGLSMKDHGCMATSAFPMYISIKGMQASVLSLTVHPLTEPSAILLSANYPMFSFLHQGDLDYYYVEASMDTYHDVHLHLVVTMGDVDLYVSASWDTRPVVVDGAMNPSSYLYSSSHSGNALEDFTLTHSQVRGICNTHQRSSSSCYMVLAVFGKGSSGSSSQYTISVTAMDSTTAIALGTPITGHVSEHENNYYRLVVVDYADLIVSLTPFYGDPDVFISVAPNTHPSARNLTWASAAWGADSITIQAADLASHCSITPNSTTGDTCNVYLGVSGFRNSSYTLLAHMDTAFSSALTLLEGQPQTGYVESHSYVYYKFYISDSDEARLIGSISIALTSLQGEGDQDLYVSFDGEPGHDHYDYHSSLSSSSVDEITIDASSSHYCLGCYVYVAVYGFTHGHFTITCTSKGITNLQAGRAITGHVEQDSYRYYKYRNNDPTAVLTVTLTQSFGDPDLFIDTHVGDEKPIFPTIHYGTFIWSSRRSYSNDVIVIKYDDPQFCVGCDYLLAVYGYKNSSYTLSITSAEDEVIHLLHDRPQRLLLPHGGDVKHCAYMVSSQSESLVISLSSLDMGSADLYAKALSVLSIPSNVTAQMAMLPNPSDQSSYDYSTIGSEDDVIQLPGPFANETIVLITVKALSSVSLSILVSTSESTITLQKGIPTNSYVASMGMQYFKFYLEDPTASLQITLTARSGDPDLMASMDFPRAVCSPGNMLSCTNYTWRSASYNSDRILISPDEPCSSDTTTMYVNREACDVSRSYRQGYMYITVAGYTMSKFIITTSIVGEHITLLPGKPQLATTSQEFVCSSRDEDTGGCDIENSAINKRVNLAYFTVSMSPTAEGGSRSNVGADRTSGNLMLAIKPDCNWNDTSSHLNEDGYILTDDNWYNGRICQLGCDCDPLRVYVQSCIASECTVLDRYPSEIEGHYDASMTISSTGSSFFIQYDPFNPRNGYCDPNEHQESCVYYIAVTGSFNKEYTEQGTSFVITAAASDDVSLVPCDADASKAADGVRLHTIDSITTDMDGKYYEVCNTNREVDESLIVNLEQCYGSSTLAACTEEGEACTTSVLPNEDNWAYKTDGMLLCTRKSSQGDDRCSPLAEPSESHQSLTIPLSSGNVYVWVAGSNAEYDIKMSTTKNGGHQRAILVQGSHGSGDGSSMENTLIKADVELRSVSISWSQSLVVLPGMKQPVFSANVRYHIMAVNMGSIDDTNSHYHYDTICGADHLLASLGPSVVKIYNVPSTPVATPTLTHNLAGLQGGHRYRIMVYAKCDHTCLKQITETTAMDLDVKCSGENGEECHTITFMYTHTDVQTEQNTIAGEDDEDNVFMDDLITISFSVAALVILALCMFGAQYARRKKLADATRYEITEMVDLDMWTSTHATPSQLISQMKRQTALTSPVLDSGEGGGLEESLSGGGFDYNPMTTPGTSPLTRGLLNLTSPMHDTRTHTHTGSHEYSPMVTSDEDPSSSSSAAV